MMNFDSLGEFLSMRGYARFVWPAYAVAIGVLVYNVLGARRALRRGLEEARRRIAMERKP